MKNKDDFMNGIEYDVEGLNSKSIDNLLEYNDIIETFKKKFNEIKDELALKV